MSEPPTSTCLLSSVLGATSIKGNTRTDKGLHANVWRLSAGHQPAGRLINCNSNSNTFPNTYGSATADARDSVLPRAFVIFRKLIRQKVSVSFTHSLSLSHSNLNTLKTFSFVDLFFGDKRKIFFSIVSCAKCSSIPRDENESEDENFNSINLPPATMQMKREKPVPDGVFGVSSMDGN